MTELTFLLDLLLNHKLPQATKKAVTERVREVEVLLQMTSVTINRIPSMAPSIASITSGNLPPHLANQAPSTIAAMLRNGLANEAPTIGIVAQQPSVEPVQVIAQTPAAAAAMNARQEAINSAMSGKPEKGRTSPRKF